MTPTGDLPPSSGSAQTVAAPAGEIRQARGSATARGNPFIVTHHDQDVWDLSASPDHQPTAATEPTQPTEGMTLPALPDYHQTTWWQHHHTPPNWAAIGLASDQTAVPDQPDGTISPLRLPSPVLSPPAGAGYPPVGSFNEAVGRLGQPGGIVHRPAAVAADWERERGALAGESERSVGSSLAEMKIREREEEGVREGEAAGEEAAKEKEHAVDLDVPGVLADEEDGDIEGAGASIDYD